MVGAAHQRPRLDMAETERQRAVTKDLELLRGDISLDGEVGGGWPEILTEGQDLTPDASQVFENAHELIFALTQPEHEPRLGEEPATAPGGMLQDGERAGVPGPWSYPLIQPWNRLDVVIEE